MAKTLFCSGAVNYSCWLYLLIANIMLASLHWRYWSLMGTPMYTEHCSPQLVILGFRIEIQYSVHTAQFMSKTVHRNYLSYHCRIFRFWVEKKYRAQYFLSSLVALKVHLLQTWAGIPFPIYFPTGTPWISVPKQWDNFFCFLSQI